MPVTYDVEAHAKAPMVLTQLTGSVTFAELSDYFEQLIGDTRVNSRCVTLVDLTAIESFDATAEEIRWVTGLHNALPSEKQEAREAIVAQPDSVEFGLARMFQLLSPGRVIRVFTDMVEARAWLRESVPSMQ